MTIATFFRTSIWRESAGALPNSLAIGYAVAGYIAGFVLMASESWWGNGLGVLLTAHAMLIAAYLVHEAAHYTLFARPAANHWAGEAMSFIAGSGYARFERIRHMHLRHHRDRADVACFSYQSLLRNNPLLRRLVYGLEWAYVPAVEIIMHLQVMVRPFVEADQAAYRTRAAAMMVVRLGLLLVLLVLAPKAVLLYFVAYGLLLTALNFFDAFHHTFKQYFVPDNVPVPMENRDRDFEQANTYSNTISVHRPWLNLITLNFGYHNAHHEQAAVPWYRLPRLHRELFGVPSQVLMALPELLRTFHRNRLKRILDDDYGAVGTGPDRADNFIGAHGVSFLTVV